ncbi:Beta/alpha-amylase precursor [Pelomyxa schiedti]|nr:Beta/alpha-amylase precursor [Pelomyxa schiedti]
MDVYHLLPDRFRSAGTPCYDGEFPPGFYGGSVRETIDALPYIRALGFSAVFIGPFLFNHEHAYHGYHTLDFERLDPRLFGTRPGENPAELPLELMAELRQACDTNNLKIIFDFVPNHIHRDHPWIRDAEHRDWFFRDSHGEPCKFFLGCRELVKINLNHRPAREYILRLAMRLIPYIDVLRVDHALGCSKDFLRELTQQVHAAKADALVLGEFWVDENLWRDSNFLSLIDTFDALDLSEKEQLRVMKTENYELQVVQHFLQITFAGGEDGNPQTFIVDGALDFEANLIIQRHAKRLARDSICSRISKCVPGPGVITLLYKSGWQQSYIHFSVNPGGLWTDSPGFAMKPSCREGWWGINIPASCITFCLTNGTNDWDNNSTQNYTIDSPGVFDLEDGNLKCIHRSDTIVPRVLEPECRVHFWGSPVDANECSCGEYLATEGLIRELSTHFERYPHYFILPQFLDNHDTNRIMLTCGNQYSLVLSIAAAVRHISRQFNHPFFLYYGTELGMTHFKDIRSMEYGDNQARQPFRWGRKEYTQHIVSMTGALFGSSTNSEIALPWYLSLGSPDQRTTTTTTTPEQRL